MAKKSSRSKAKPKSTPEDTARSINGSLVLTPLHQKLATLQEERQWLLKQIRRKRTELDNFMSQMRDIVTELFQRGSESFKEVRDLDEEIHALFQEVLTQRKLRKRSKQQIEDIYLSLQMQGAISFRQIGEDGEDEDGFDFSNEEEEFFSEGDRDPSGDRTSPFEPPPSESTDEAQASHRQNRDLRQTFLRLAAIYHPDRATDEDEQLQNTEVMKEINRAYKSGDFARLLELERQQQGGDLMEAVISASDDLEQACQRLERENESLQNQYEGIKAELRELRNQTQEGMMVTAYRRADREGIDFVGELLAESEMELQSLRRVRDFVRDFRDRKITLKEFLAGPTPSRPSEDMLAELEEMLGVQIVVDPDFF